MKTSILFVILCLQIVLLSIHGASTGHLKLKMTDHGKVAGCWKDHDPVLSMCFHISDRLMRIMYTQNRRMIVLYHTNDEKNMHYIQVLGLGLLRYKTQELRVPMFVSKPLARKVMKRKVKQLSSGSKAPSGLYSFIKEILQANKHRAFMKTAGRRLLTKEEVVVLEKISSSLRKHPLASRLPKLVERFFLLCLGLLRSVGPSKSSSVVYEDCHNEIPEATIFKTYQERPGYHKNILANEGLTSHGCEDMRNGTDPECFGMCGKTCWCWAWVCGDCCIHKGCLQHDACCRCSNPPYLSTYCLLPFIYGFDCKKGYNGYPECVHN